MQRVEIVPPALCRHPGIMDCDATDAGWSASLVQRYFPEPYRFIAPYRSTFWCRIARYLIPRQLRRNMQVTRWQFQGLDRLRASLAAGAGVMLASNHCRWPDPLVLGTLGIEMRK